MDTQIQNIFVQAAFMIGFSLIHSIGSTDTVKEKVRRYWPRFFAWYRLAYNLVSLFLLVLWYFLPKPQGYLYQLASPFSLVFYAVQLACVIGFLLALSDFSGGEFLGVRQVIRFLKERKVPQRDENYDLNTGGMYRICRHPLYFFSIGFFLFIPEMSVSSALITLWLIFYFYIGSVFEEKRLIKIFGKEYMEYRRSVSRIFPWKWLRNKLRFSG